VLDDSIEVVCDPAEAMAGADLVVCAIPCQFIRPVFKDLARFIQGTPTLVSVAKGIEIGTLMRPTEILSEQLSEQLGPGEPATVCLSGPTIATELMQHKIATMVASSECLESAQLVQSVFSTSWLRIYTNTDLVGVEFAGAVKNVVAIAAGIIDGLEEGFNAKSALLARGLAEIVRLGQALGAQAETFFGIAGVGDLATTCFSPEGRNRSCGEAIGRGMPLKQYLEESQCVVEGVASTESIMSLARKLDVEVPILSAVNAVITEGSSPREAISTLLSRELGDERVG
jgi:glycerol-3-phosphate dehydrogenase (NAD(P)+)